MEFSILTQVAVACSCINGINSLHLFPACVERAYLLYFYLPLPIRV